MLWISGGFLYSRDLIYFYKYSLISWSSLVLLNIILHFAFGETEAPRRNQWGIVTEDTCRAKILTLKCLWWRGNPFRNNGIMLVDQIRGSLLTISVQLHSLFCLFLSTKCSNRIAALWSKRNDYRKEQLEKTRQKYLDFSQWESITVTNGLRMFLFFFIK